MLAEAEKTPSHFDNAIIEWSAPPRHKPQKGTAWFIIMSFAVAALLYYAIASQTGSSPWPSSWRLLPISSITEEHKELEIKISEYGIKIGKRRFRIAAFVHFGSLSSAIYWAITHPNPRKNITGFHHRVKRQRPRPTSQVSRDISWSGKERRRISGYLHATLEIINSLEKLPVRKFTQT